MRKREDKREEVKERATCSDDKRGKPVPEVTPEEVTTAITTPGSSLVTCVALKSRANFPLSCTRNRGGEQKPVSNVEWLIVLQPGDSELQGGVVLHATLQLHRSAPLGHLVLRHPVDPGGVYEDKGKADH